MAYQRKTKKRGRQGEGGGRPKKYTVEVIEKLADDLLKWIEGDEKRYWLKSFAIENGIPAENLSEFANQNPKFRQSLKLAKDIQERRLVGLGMSASFTPNAKPAFIIFALKNVAGWRDTQDVNMNVSGLVKFVEDIPA